MPFREHNGFSYTPEKLAQLQAIFNDIWQQVSQSPPSDPPTQMLRNDIAKKIIHAEQAGLGPDAIREAILSGK